ncbi:TonB system transport protein ExbD [Campylobacter hyointestinalis]|uniref:Biopolymer transport protein ExbD n=1 Tax=Campylobacter hyointestinalis subsp. hyointestinalis TaxID=91352 RepID=A0A0S4RDB4_CAMHY|nr:TonB system transport protein ExbD [Campylobacter hyointestinalis]MBT0611366.1 TonB system transport protein ExbD [Campylobacter hyointestinalis subsp. hyointestinalis]MDY2999857.1 TonB system transport protein ExbD [Campylobacter hyointestinalis]PPB51957.1 TonB system transport protein ExbD [Campylobacter hyointestinalis subsp. hyointestinalis]PPB53370.1 TonB system transport protein ExbD [Campylobacter hyointestinalis subsp. hyointestinalis]PPB61523.1 TonB system transport protein ExbD [C
MVKLPKNEGLNIIPFIDIMLVLLAIVLSVSTFIAQGEIKINLPKSQSAASLSDEIKKLLITIDENNKFYLDDKETSIDDIKSKFENLSLDTFVELKSDKNAKFESFIQIIDLLKLKNHDKFQIITEKEQ